MKVRVKRKSFGGVERIQTSGEIKEVLINQDFLNPKQVSVSLCFMGDDGSGIIDFIPEEIEMINKEIRSRKKLLKRAKVLKFKRTK